MSLSLSLRVLARLLGYPDAELRTQLPALREALRAEHAVGAARLHDPDSGSPGSGFPGSPDTDRGRRSVANIKSQIKRIKTNEKARLRNKSVKSSLKTAVRKYREAADAGDAATATTLMRDASRALDKAASKGVIHANQAANRKSAMAKQTAGLAG